MMKHWVTLFFLCYFFHLGQSLEHPFDYDVHLFSLPRDLNRAMICFHGYGGNYKIALSLKNLTCIKATLISFNFPEYDIKQRRTCDPRQATFGTIDELLPALYIIKETVDMGFDIIDLYGFSAGGGAVINVLKILNTSTYDENLKKIGIGLEEKKKMLSIIQEGIVILDSPLKSIEEIIAFRGSTEELELLAKNYRDHDLRPIDSLFLLKGLSLDILLHFQKSDEILSNRDDYIYIKRLQSIQPQGKVTIIIEDEGGHITPHTALWRYYSEKMLESQSKKEKHYD